MPEKDPIREVGLIAYLTYAISIVAGPLVIFGVIYCYMKRGDVSGTYAEGHLTWLIRTFWLTLVATIVGYVLIFVLIGFVILGAVWLWFVYRVVRGLVIFNDGRPLPDPYAFV